MGEIRKKENGAPVRQLQLWLDKKSEQLSKEEIRLEAMQEELLDMNREDPRLKVMTDVFIESRERAIKIRDALAKGHQKLQKHFDMINEELSNLENAWAYHTQCLRDELQGRECRAGRGRAA